ncbi:MAG: hypothetical protein A2V70_19805 [Planctomycetes bacterium RBG_13_63_9]|nr:MAG: hypothetical protein A2V70_19805 [Planctomycetes bacterium RBG_13_63_9]
MAGRDYRVLHGDGGVAFGVHDLPEAELRRLLEDPEGLLRLNLDRPVKIDHGSLMVEAELSLVRGPVRVAYKQYRPRNRWKAFCGLLRRSRARRAWRLGRELSAHGIATARPLAMCEPHRPGLSGRSYLATLWIPSAVNLHLYGWALADRPLRQRLRSAGRCAESLGRLLGRMHALGIAHRDLKGANLLVRGHHDPTGDGPVRTYLVDVDGVRICRRLRAGRRAANLARLATSTEAHRWLTRSIYCRFVRAYAGQFPAGQVQWKQLWREISSRRRRIVQRKRRRGEEVL